MHKRQYISLMFDRFDITELLYLSIQAETTHSRKKAQIAKMKGGKLNKRLLTANVEANKRRSGVKLDN